MKSFSASSYIFNTSVVFSLLAIIVDHDRIIFPSFSILLPTTYEN